MGDRVPELAVFIHNSKSRDPKTTVQQKLCRLNQQVALPLHVSLLESVTAGGEESVLMMPLQGSAKRSRPLLCQSEVSSFRRGLAHLTLETEGIAPPKRTEIGGRFAKSRAFNSPTEK